MRNMLSLFYLVMDHDPNLVFVKDEQGHIVYANRAFLELYAPEARASILGTTTVEAFSPEEAAVWLAGDRRAMATGSSEAVEEIFDYLGRRRVLLTRKIAFHTADGEPRLLGISTDVTTLKGRERSLVEANDSLSQFAAFAAHDLRSPLASIATAIDTVMCDADTSLGARAKQVLGLARESASGLSQQVTTLLASALASDVGELELRATDLNLLLEEVRFNLSSLIDRHGATITWARLPSLQVERNLFRQLLQNLVENAVRHRSDERSPRVTVRHLPAEDADVIVVEDNGIGISAADAIRVFEAFERGSEAGDGTGLGLALCRRVVGLHAGSIGFDTTYAEGCRTLVTIPRQPAWSAWAA